MKEDLVSIIVPVYNSEKFIGDTINTVQEQTYQNWELLLINDCSTDESKKVIEKQTKSDDRIKLIELGRKSGAALARNRGVDIANGQYLCFLDADDLWDKDKLRKQTEFMKKNDCAFSYTSYEFANENGQPTGKKVIAKDKLTYNKALKNNIISTITVMFDLKKIDKELLKMPNLKYVEDTATWWSILRNKYIAYGMPSVFSYYRRTPNTTSSNKLKTQKPLWNLYRNVEKLNFFEAIYCLFWKNLHALVRRI